MDSNFEIIYVEIHHPDVRKLYNKMEPVKSVNQVIFFQDTDALKINIIIQDVISLEITYSVLSVNSDI